MENDRFLLPSISLIAKAGCKNTKLSGYTRIMTGDMTNKNNFLLLFVAVVASQSASLWSMAFSEQPYYLQLICRHQVAQSIFYD
jgi:hypothetical protein